MLFGGLEKRPEREREESHFLNGGKKGGKMDVAEVPLAAEENRFQAGETRGAASASAAWAVATFPLTSWNLEPFRP